MTVASDAIDTDDAEGVRPTIGEIAFERGVRGTAVWVEVVDRDEEDEDVEGAGDADRGEEVVGISVLGGEGGLRDSIVSEYKLCKEVTKCW